MAREYQGRLRYSVSRMLSIHRVYAAGLSQAGALDRVMTEPAQYAGVVAGFSILGLFVTATGFMRRRQYEVFYVAHVLLVAIILITGKSSCS